MEKEQTKNISKPIPTVSFHTLGCRLNFSESSDLAEKFIHRGYKVVPFGQESDVTFINTCTVTDGADSSCRNIIRKAHRTSPEGKVVVAGCYAQMEADKIKQMQGVDLILGTNEKFKVFDYLYREEETLVAIDKTNEFWGASTGANLNHSRAFLKIQDGCNYICSFCIIPFARGRSRTISVEQARNEVKKLIKLGFKEIVLTGVNIGEYESTSGERLEDLIKSISELDGLERLRLSSVEPNTITKSLLQTLKDVGIYQDHFHVPLQSGCNEILKSMKRKYNREFYQDILWMIKDYFPMASIGGDIIAGFPGETREQFEETKNFVSLNPLTHFHVFPYSKRKNTVAAKMDNHIQGDEKSLRVKKLIELGEEKLKNLSRENSGRPHQILFENRKPDGYFHGYTSNFLKVKVKSEEDLKNKILSMTPVWDEQLQSLVADFH